MRGERIATPVVGPTTTALVQGSSPMTVHLIAATWSGAGTLTARVGSGSGALIGYLSVAGAGSAVLPLPRGVLCQTGLHFTITGTCTESAAHVS